MTTSSNQEDKRYAELELMQKAGKISCLKRHFPMVCIIDGIETFGYTPDSSYIENGVKIVEEFKGYIFERHDSILRIKVISATSKYQDCEFRIVKPKGLWRTYKAGKAIRACKPNSRVAQRKSKF